MGRGSEHDPILLIRSEMVSIDNALHDRAPLAVPAILVAPMQCNNQGSSSKGHEKHSIECLEVHITICDWNGIRLLDKRNHAELPADV